MERSERGWPVGGLSAYAFHRNTRITHLGRGFAVGTDGLALREGIFQAVFDNTWYNVHISAGIMENNRMMRDRSDIRLPPIIKRSIEAVDFYSLPGNHAGMANAMHEKAVDYVMAHFSEIWIRTHRGDFEYEGRREVDDEENTKPI